MADLEFYHEVMGLQCSSDVSINHRCKWRCVSAYSLMGQLGMVHAVGWNRAAVEKKCQDKILKEISSPISTSRILHELEQRGDLEPTPCGFSYKGVYAHVEDKNDGVIMDLIQKMHIKPAMRELMRYSLVRHIKMNPFTGKYEFTGSEVDIWYTKLADGLHQFRLRNFTIIFNGVPEATVAAIFQMSDKMVALTRSVTVRARVNPEAPGVVDVTTAMSGERRQVNETFLVTLGEFPCYVRDVVERASIVLTRPICIKMHSHTRGAAGIYKYDAVENRFDIRKIDGLYQIKPSLYNHRIVFRGIKCDRAEGQSWDSVVDRFNKIRNDQDSYVFICSDTDAEGLACYKKLSHDNEPNDTPYIFLDCVNLDDAEKELIKASVVFRKLADTIIQDSKQIDIVIGKKSGSVYVGRIHTVKMTGVKEESSLDLERLLEKVSTQALAILS